MPPGTYQPNSLILICGKFVQFLHQMRNDPVAAESVVLFIDIPHDLPVRDRIVSVLHVASIALIEAIPKQRHHGLPYCLLVIGALAELPDLSVVLPGNYAQRDNAELLHPVFLNDLPHGIPVHRHSPLSLFGQPDAAVIVMWHHRPPGAIVAIVHHTLRPSPMVVIPYLGGHFVVSQQQVRALGTVAGAGIDAPETGIAGASARAIAPQPHRAACAVFDVIPDDIGQVDIHRAGAGFHDDSRFGRQHRLSVRKRSFVAVPYRQCRRVGIGNVDVQDRRLYGQRLFVLSQQTAQVWIVHAEGAVGGIIDVVVNGAAGTAGAKVFAVRRPPGICLCHAHTSLRHGHQAYLTVCSAGWQCAGKEYAQTVERRLRRRSARTAVGDGDRRRHARMEDAVAAPTVVHSRSEKDGIVHTGFIAGRAHLQHAAVVAGGIIPGSET